MERGLYLLHLLIPLVVMLKVNYCMPLHLATIEECWGAALYFDAISSNQPDVQYLIKSRKLDTTKRQGSKALGMVACLIFLTC